MFEEIAKIVGGPGVVGAIVFGSSVYAGRGRDVDLLVVTERSLGPRERAKAELELGRKLRDKLGKPVDLHIMGLEEFEENLEPGTFLSGLALGYEILLGSEKLEPLVTGFLSRLAREEKLVFHGKRGTWNLAHHARVLLALKQASRSQARDA